ncbi:transcription repressor MYB4 [Corchorus capsularis]|uniref:Transcription repressor MYB4 n=1 Tax=Corchorus capsularis TaxID=210143 RepID=A0A1R3GBT4_COCAP|nr:transcription repressor MYB4 [Corchorus capsularis]
MNNINVVACNNNKPPLPKGSLADNDRVSDAASCLEDEKSAAAVSNLDLDLTIAFPSIKRNEENNYKQQTSKALIGTRDLQEENYATPTLLLFR